MYLKTRLGASRRIEQITAAGLAGGVLGIAAVARLLRGVLPGLSGVDPLPLGAAGIVLLAAATVALLIPARRAARSDPVAALRAD